MLGLSQRVKPGLILALAAMLGASVVLGVLFVSTPVQAIATAPTLGTAGSFAVLGASGVTNTGDTVVDGNLGVYSGTSITGFPPGIVNGTIHSADAVASQAQDDVTVAWNALTAQACDVDLTGQDLGGMTLTPGVYCFDSSAGLTGTLTLNGGANDVWVFKTGSTLITATSSAVVFADLTAGQACNVFWQVGSSATLNTATAFIGNILAKASISLSDAASISGRLLARTAAVTMINNHATAVTCSIVPTPTAIASTATPLVPTPTAIASTPTPLVPTPTAIASTATPVVLGVTTTPVASPVGGLPHTGGGPRQNEGFQWWVLLLAASVVGSLSVALVRLNRRRTHPEGQ